MKRKAGDEVEPLLPDGEDLSKLHGSQYSDEYDDATVLARAVEKLSKLFLQRKFPG
jgi:hypothetical protein